MTIWIVETDDDLPLRFKILCKNVKELNASLEKKITKSVMIKLGCKDTGFLKLFAKNPNFAFNLKKQVERLNHE